MAYACQPVAYDLFFKDLDAAGATLTPLVNDANAKANFAKFDLVYSGDITKALELMKATGDEIKADPNFSSNIVSPIEIAGVDRVSEAGVMLKARIRTAPGKQWGIQREYLRRIRLVFEREGIEFTQTTTRLIAPEPPAPRA